ncbi:MAG: glycosyltransferase family 2 protein [Rhodobiaceae bacterium]|nr:glycosyltransferase family 2 protein [Rhodobiaceae bacterium]MCC0054362.1 glycosyltransferase family 2 protein [Rhodobiaceae bacterium]
MKPPEKSSISIVAPCYNEELVLDEFLSRTHAAGNATGFDYEIILVDDGSVDGTWGKIDAAAKTEPRVRGLRLFRNHGHQLALSAGLHEASGDFILTIDADLQDPPELLGDMIALMRAQEADVVYGKRRSRAGETRFKLWTAHIFYRVLRAMTAVDIPSDTGDFRLMRRDVVYILNAMPERHRFIRGMVAWIGGRQIPIHYDRDPRFAGQTKYPLRKMIRFSIDAITSFSRYPLTLAIYVGAGMGALSFFLGLWSIVSYFFLNTTAGWTSLMTVVTLQFTLVFFCIGMIGEYVGRVFESNQNRPLFTTRTRVGCGLNCADMSREPNRQDTT